jgi:carbon monoxide dehydrogenase subunit G
MRVEDVNGQGRRARWTAVLQTDTGSGVRADFRCTASTKNERFAWSQDLEGTAFERIFKAVALEIRLAAESGGTQVSLTTDEALRGLSRLGSPMMKSAARRRLDEAFDGIERALVGEPG